MVQASSVVSIAGLLVFGTLSSIASKVVYQTEGETFDGSIKNFKKPWASTALMFVAMVSLSLDKHVPAVKVFLPT